MGLKMAGTQRNANSFFSRLPREFIIAVTASFVLLQLTFLGNMAYLYGTVFRQRHRYAGMKMLAVDYDGGAIGSAISAAYETLRGDSFPAIDFHSASEYATPTDIRDAVCKGSYWGAIYVHSGATDRLEAALSGGSAAETYNSSDAVSYIYNSVRYAVFIDSTVVAKTQVLMGAARSMYGVVNGTAAVASLNTTDPTAVAAFYNPFDGTAEPIAPTEQGARVLYSTVTMVFPILMQFFLIMALNGMAGAMMIPTQLSGRQYYLCRFTIQKMYTFVGSMATAGYIWAFKEDWDVTYSQWALTWMAFWLYMDINYNLIDSLLNIVIPMQFASFFMVTWVILNVASTIVPFSLVPGFYRWTYALPAHETYTVLYNIWSHGCGGNLGIALGVLFIWWVPASIGSYFACIHHCRKASQEAIVKAVSNSPESFELGSNTSGRDANIV
jgi:hypothetical protein